MPERMGKRPSVSVRTQCGHGLMQPAGSETGNRVMRGVTGSFPWRRRPDELLFSERDRTNGRLFHADLYRVSVPITSEAQTKVVPHVWKEKSRRRPAQPESAQNERKSNDMKNHNHHELMRRGRVVMLQVLLLMAVGTALGQGVGIGTTTFSPTTDALLELRSVSGGLLITRMTQAQRDAIATPSEGLLIYQTDNIAGFYYFNGFEWMPFSNQDIVVESYDNLGNHIARQELVLDGNAIVNTSGGGGIRIDDEGQVSIGNAHTDSPLAVKGSSVASFEGPNNGVVSVVSEQTAFNFVPLDFAHDNSTTPMARIAAQMSGQGAKLYIGTSNNTTLGITNTAMTIDESGNVGIGTKVPGRKLELMNGDLLLSQSLGAAGGMSFQGTGAGLTTVRAGAQGATHVNYTLPLQQGAANTILANNGSGQLSWNLFSAMLGTATRAVNGNGTAQGTVTETFADLGQMTMSVEAGTYIVLFNAQFTMSTGQTIGEFAIHCESTIITESLRQVMAPANNAPGNVTIMSVLNVTGPSNAKIIFRRVEGSSGTCTVNGRTLILIRIV